MRLGFAGASTFVLRDARGRQVVARTGLSLPGDERIDLPANLAPGVYVATVSIGERTASRRVLVTH